MQRMISAFLSKLEKKDMSKNRENERILQQPFSTMDLQEDPMTCLEVIRGLATQLIPARDGCFILEKRWSDGTQRLLLTMRMQGKVLKALQLRTSWEDENLVVGFFGVSHHGIEELFFYYHSSHEQFHLSMRHGQRHERYVLLDRGMQWIKAVFLQWVADEKRVHP
jgi:hypothetical protein